MASVDNRVVKMEFDNRSFQEKISVTTNSLAKLKASLNFSKSSDSLKEVSTTANGINLSALSSSVATATAGFNVLAGAAAVALGGIASKAAATGIQIAKSFVIGPISDGFKEYETNMQSVQTILANTATKGTTLDDVNAALDQLNQYSDQTIYNFASMAKNIGTFTAAGVGLDTSVNAIKGIANLAALSGSSAEQASNAMYQLSQAISTGSLKLMDWNSITNAGMGGEAFKNTLFETAKAMGTLKDVPLGQSLAEWEKANGSFRESLEKGWISSDVLTTALSTFTGDMNAEMLMAKGFSEQQATLLMQQAARAKAAATEVKTFTQLLGTVKESIGTGWADSFKIVIGNFTEAKELFTKVNTTVSGIVGKSADARNSTLLLWKSLNGRNALIDGLTNTFAALGKVLTTIKAAFSSVFPPMTGEKLLALTVSFQKFANALMPSEATLSKLKSIMQGIFSVFSIVLAVVKGVVSVFVALFSTLSSLAGQSNILGFFAKIGDSIFKLQQALVAGGGISKFFDTINEGIKVLLGGVFGKALDAVSLSADRVGNRFGFVTEMSGPLSKAFQFISDKAQGLIDQLTKLANLIQEKVFPVGKSVGDALAAGFNKENFDGAIDAANVGLFAGLLLILRKFVKNTKGFTVLFKNGFLDNLGKTFDNLNGVLGQLQKSIKADMILKIAIALGIMAVSLLLLSLIDSAKLASALVALGVSFGMLAGMMYILDKIASSMKKSASIAILVVGLIGLAAAMLIFGIAVKIFSSMSWDELTRGLFGVAAMLAMVTIAMKVMPDAKRLISAGVGIAAVAVGVGILALAVKVMASMTWDQMMQGLLGLGLALAGIILAIRLMPDDMLTKSAGLVALGLGLIAISFAIKTLGGMDQSALSQGLIGIALAIAGVLLAMHLMPKDMLATSIALVAVGIALTIIANVIKTIGTMDFDSLKQGILGIGAVLLILAVAMYAMSSAIPGAIALAIVSVSLLLLAKAIGAFAAISWDTLLKGLLMIGVVILALALAANLLSPALPALLGLGIALALIGAGLILFGVGAFFLAKALVLIGEAGKKSVEVLVDLFNVIILTLPKLIIAVGAAIIEIANMVVAALPKLIAGLGVALMALLNELVKLIPKYMEVVGVLISSILKLIREKVPEYIATGLFLLVSFLKGILDNLPLIVILVGEIIVSFINALSTEIPRIIAAGVNLLTKLIEGVASVMYLVGGASLTILTAFIEGLTAGVDKLIRAGTDLIVTVITGIGNAMGEIVTAGADTIVKFLEGLSNNIQKVVDAGWDFIIDLVHGIRMSIKDNMPQLIEEFKGLAGDLIQGLKNGLTDSIGSFGGIIGDIGQSILDSFTGFFDIFSPSKKTKKIGGYLIDGLAVGISKSGIAEKAATGAGKGVMNALNDSLLAVSASFTSLDQLNPVIAPVLDLTNVRKEAGLLNDIMGVPTIDTSSSFRKALNISMDATNAKDATVQTVQTTNEIKFEQIINAPTALTTNDIYRNTKTQISLAKEELKIT